MVVAFIGTHVPLLAILFYFLNTATVAPSEKVRIATVALIATLAGTAITLFALHSLLSPIGAAAQALKNYWSQNQLPNLPTDFSDDAGVLMANTTEIIKKLDDFIHYIEDYDSLTGLPNRKVFQSKIQTAIASVQPEQKITLFLLDIDDFKDINTAESHTVGDRILRAIAHRLSQCTDCSQSLARIGSDEFAILKTTFQGEPDFLTAKDLLSIIDQPYPNISANFPVTASIGISVYPTDEHSLDQNICDQLIANAYTGLQKAKAKGNNNYEFYSDGMTAAVQKRLKLTNDLRSALENNQLFLHYQPRVDWRSGEMVGAECLVRWQHPELGTMLPAEFIPIAEETGLILPISEWLLKTACQQNKVWQRSGLKPFTVAVNLSARQIEQSNLADFVRRTLEETDLAPEFLELEVTESLLIGNIEHTLSVLTALHNQGVVLALDDFGTGYSSLSYLRRFPFDVLKIDRSFVRDMVHSADVAAITKAVGALAQGLQLGLVAEGVETEEQLNQIKTYGCHEIQGYYFSRPLSVAALSQLLRGPNPWQDKTLSGNSLPHRDSLSSRDSLPTVIHHSV